MRWHRSSSASFATHRSFMFSPPAANPSAATANGFSACSRWIARRSARTSPCRNPHLSRSPALRRTHRAELGSVPAQCGRSAARREHLPAPRRHRARDRVRGGARVNAYGIAGTASCSTTGSRSMARPPHGPATATDAARDARLELRSASRTESAMLRTLVGLRRRLPAGGGRRRCRRRAQRVSDHEAIANLVTKSLICAIRARTPRYRLLDTTRTYAHGKLNEPAKPVSSPAGTPSISATSSSARRPRPTPQTEWLEHLWRGAGQCARRVDWAFSPDGDAQLGVALTAAAVTLWVPLSLLAECRERTERRSPRSETPATLRAFACSCRRRAAGR